MAGGTEWPGMRNWGVTLGTPLIPFLPCSELHSLVEKCYGRGRGSDSGLTVLEALAALKASETKTFLRLHLEREKVFPLGFVAAGKQGLISAVQDKSKPLSSCLPAAVQGRLCVHRAGGLGLACLSPSLGGCGCCCWFPQRKRGGFGVPGVGLVLFVCTCWALMLQHPWWLSATLRLSQL